MRLGPAIDMAFLIIGVLLLAGVLKIFFHFQRTQQYNSLFS